MPVVIVCPSCQRRLRMGEHMVGRSVKCPACAHPFLAALAPSEPPASEGAPETVAAAVSVGKEPAGGTAAPAESAPPPSVPSPETPAPSTDVLPFALPAGQSQTEVLVEYLLFRRMIAPLILQIFFWVGVLGSIFGGMAMIVTSVAAFNATDLAGLGRGLGLLFLGPLAFRLYCEIVLLFFRIHETLLEIKGRLPQSAATSPSASATPLTNPAEKPPS